MEKVKINLKLTSVQMRGFAALVRYMCPAEIERIAHEAGEAECILSALDEIQSALVTSQNGDSTSSGGSATLALVRGQDATGKQTLKGLEDILLGGAANVDTR
jgi:hypothetical protein